ncbi:MAG TPA: peptidase M48 [Gammaproteobacteria bacterium]|nr:peptidase M48 [Gammaproteobacteria bacterium]
MNHEILFRHKLLNAVQSVLMLLGMTLILGLLAYLLGGREMFWWAIVTTALVFILAPQVSPRMLMHLYQARPLAPGEVPALHEMIATLSRHAGLPTMPTLYYIPSRIMNALTVGRQDNAAILVTDGMLRNLSLRELQGVMAHEISHIRNNDIWVMRLADTVSRAARVLSLFGQMLLFINLPLILFSATAISWPAILLLIFAPGAADLLQLALSRVREFDADLGAAHLTGDPEGLASALVKLERQQRGGWLSQVFLPGRREPQPSLLRTHPPTRARIERLLSLKPSRTSALPPAYDQPGVTEGLPVISRPPRRHWSGLWH